MFENLNIGGIVAKDTRETALNPISEISVDLIREDPKNHRTAMDQQGLKELAESIGNPEIGLLCPISLRRNSEGKGYTINHGHRRFRACKMAGLKTVPAFLSESVSDLGQFAENIHRENLSVMDVANTLSELKHSKNLTNNELAKLVSKSPTWVSRYLSTTEAPDFIQKAAKDGKLATSEAITILANECATHEPEVRKLLESEEVISISRARDFAGKLKQAENESEYKDDKTIDFVEELNGELKEGGEISPNQENSGFPLAITSTTDTEIFEQDEGESPASSNEQEGSVFNTLEDANELPEIVDIDEKLASNDKSPLNLGEILELFEVVALTDVQAEYLIGFIDDKGLEASEKYEPIVDLLEKIINEG